MAGACLVALATVLSVLAASFLLLALIPLGLGFALAIRGRLRLGATLSVAALVIPIAGHVLLASFVVKAYEVPSEAMLPTLRVGDRVLVDRTGLGGFAVGDIVVFHPPAGADVGTKCGVRHPPTQACPQPTASASSQVFLKRIVAGPGDRLSISGGHPVVDGVVKADEPYAATCEGATCNMPKPITIPRGQYFMLGDNRGASDDSRFWGPVPADWIVGVVFARYSPLSRASVF